MERARLAGGLRPLRFISSWDDGRLQDMRLADLLLKYELPAIFYLPTITCEIDHAQIRQLAQHFEIGGHTMTHPMDMKLLKNKDLWWEVKDNKDDLESILGKEITKFCYPRGRYDGRVMEIVKAAGYKSARTTKVLRFPNSVSFCDPTTIHVYQRPEYVGKDWFGLAKDYAIEASAKGNRYELWGHSWEVDRDNNWERLEELFIWLKENFEIV